MHHFKIDGAPVSLHSTEVGFCGGSYEVAPETGRSLEF